MSLENRTVVSETVRWLEYALLPKILLLDRFQYVHVQHRDTGVITVIEGPHRLRLAAHQQLLGTINPKTQLAEREYAIVLNPFDPTTGDIRTGEREVRVGPAIFSLYPGEQLLTDGPGGPIYRERVLEPSDGLLIRALRDVPHPDQPEATLPAGTEYVLKGPRRYIPHKDIRILEDRNAISLAASQGVYIQNDNTGAVRLVTGPGEVFLQPDETLWEKHLTEEEMQALGYFPQTVTDTNIRLLSATPRPLRELWDAVLVSLEDQEVIYLYDGDRVRVVFGPQSIFLEPNERPKVLHISGGFPLHTNALRLARLHLGPDYFRDRIVVRTKDNATLNLDLTYRWRFEVDQQQPEKLFALKDFIGFAAKTLSAEIRAEAAHYDYELFHSEASTLITRAVFGEIQLRRFDENSFIVFGIDVENVNPQEDKISEKLATAILSNVEIYTQTARERANLAREGELIAGRKENEEKRQSLLALEATNERQQLVEKAEIEREIHRVQAAARAEATRIDAEAQAEAIRIRARAETEAEQQRLQTIITLLQSPGGERYITLEQARVLKATDKVIVPTDARIHLGPNTRLDD